MRLKHLPPSGRHDHHAAHPTSVADTRPDQRKHVRNLSKTLPPAATRAAGITTSGHTDPKS
ncbi:hypothetical protein BN10_20010 [Phycicoccus elongatus Lp2]|uniref:Uncharacterized protein n=1 Tax=Phycicoccus elongatus Lp2 TaxID=1193181 RepID=N0E184_9MICO|nr:hypothetical protein BN10_20010 [Phycicoccus elongatus Lp2]